MVSIAALGSATTPAGPGPEPRGRRARARRALAYAGDAYGDKACTSGQDALEFSLGVAGTLAYLRSDAETRIAGLLFELTVLDPHAVGRPRSALSARR